MLVRVCDRCNKRINTFETRNIMYGGRLYRTELCKRCARSLDKEREKKGVETKATLK